MNGLTEEQARGKWCPEVRDNFHNGDIAGNRCAVRKEDPGTGAGKHKYNRCVASECMMWRWEKRHAPEPTGEECSYCKGTNVTNIGTLCTHCEKKNDPKFAPTGYCGKGGRL